MLKVNKVGRVFMAGNVTASSQTKHADIRYMYMNEYVVKILFIK